jgi:thiamine-phosphate pyrophosphorylase
MNKKQRLSKVNLYVIADKKICGESLVGRVSVGYPTMSCGDRLIEGVVIQAIEGGAQMIQYRDKQASDREFLEIASVLQNICERRKIPFIINDRVDIAAYLEVDGVHLGQDDLPLKISRKILGSSRIIGISTENIDQAKQAEKHGADYVGIGPIFNTFTKKIEKTIGLEIITQAEKHLKIPFFPIGGINLENLDQVIEAGSKGIAVGSAVICADDVKTAARKLSEKIQNLTY